MKPRASEILAELADFIIRLVILAGVGMLLWVSARKLGFFVPDLEDTVWAVLALACSLTLLVKADDWRAFYRNRDVAQPTKQPVGAVETLLHLALHRKALLALLIFGTCAILMVAVHVVSQMAQIKYSESKGVSIEISGKDSHYVAISPTRSWQSTGIRLHENQLFQVEVLAWISTAYRSPNRGLVY
jgi:hypothetical protein